MNEIESKPCPDGCPQGMVLEVDVYDPSGKMEGLPTSPEKRYRCQDCDRIEEVVTHRP